MTFDGKVSILILSFQSDDIFMVRDAVSWRVAEPLILREMIAQ